MTEQKPLSERVRGGEFQVILLGEGIGWVTNTETLDGIADEIAALEAQLAKANDSAPAETAIGAWLSAALDDPSVCAEMKRDIVNWFTFVESKKGTQPPNVQAQIDAALESVAQQYDIGGSVDARGVAYRIRSYKDANPLAELQAENEGLRDIIARAYDNLNDLPVSKEWASKWCDDADTALSDAAMQKGPQ